MIPVNPDKNRILFFRVWPDPPIAKSVMDMLVTHFPEYQIDTFDILREIKKDWKTVVLNLFFSIKEYWLEMLFDGMAPKNAFIRTTFLFERIKAFAEEKISHSTNLAFTFQLQSLFDTSSGEIPNFVYTDHTHLANFLYTEPKRFNHLITEWVVLEKTIYDNAAKIFTRSTDISKSLIGQYEISEKKVECVFAGSNIYIENEIIRESKYLNQEILFIGINWERKGGAVLVEAFTKISSNYPNALLKIIGCNPGITHPRIRVLGKIPVDQLAQHYESASMFCLPTTNEPFGVVFVEAMSFGLPIIATITGAIPDMVRNGWNGYLIEPGDVEGLAGALVKLLSSPERCMQFGKNGKTLADKDYNWNSVGMKIRKQILEYLEEKV